MDIFRRIKIFFRRLENHTEVPPTTEMMDIIIRIVVEVLSILGIAMKEIKQGRLSELFSPSNSSLTKQCTEKYLKKLSGRTNMEDALKRIDELTEEARMAVAQNLEATHTVDESVRGVANTVIGADNSVAGVDDGVAGVDDPVASRVARVNDKVASDDDQAKGINASVASVDDRGNVVADKVADVIHGAQIIFSQAREAFNNLNRSDGKETKPVIKQMANNLDQVKRSSLPQVKRSSLPNLISTDHRLGA